MSHKLTTDVIYLDFAKAFDSVVHSKLLFKLECYGINGLTLQWIKSFLCGRTQKVKIGSSFSTSATVTSGVPQGSVLGPVFFLVFINDICNSCDCGAQMQLFADDVKLYLGVKNQLSFDVIQNTLDRITNWCRVWQLNLSPTKCAVLSIGGTTSRFAYKIDGVTIPRVNSFKDLGVTIDSSLSFDSHINQMCTKANQRAALILKCFTSRDPELLIRAFIVFVRPMLEYASSVWSPYKVSFIDKVESVQRRFTKRLLGLSKLKI